MEYDSFRRNSFAPVRVGEELDVRVEAVGEKGDGVCKKKGFVLFVPGVQEGDEVRIRITKVLRKVGFAEKIGQAQGPIEEDAAPPKRQPRKNEDYAQAAKDIMRSEPEERPEDTDDFGEEEPAEEGYPEEEAPEEEAPEEEAPEEEAPEEDTPEEEAPEEEAPEEDTPEEEAPEEDDDEEDKKKED